jgi:hypothetical protein
VPTIFLKPESVNTKTGESERNSTPWRRLHNDTARKNLRRHFSAKRNATRIPVRRNI